MRKPYFSFLTVLALVVCCFVMARGQTTPPPTDEDKVYQRNEVDKPPVYLQKPRPQLNRQCRMRSSGTVRFAIILRRSGQVEISSMTQSSSCEAFDKNAYEATKNIKFDPAIKDGQPVSVATWVEYKYSIY